MWVRSARHLRWQSAFDEFETEEVQMAFRIAAIVLVLLAVVGAVLGYLSINEITVGPVFVGIGVLLAVFGSPYSAAWRRPSTISAAGGAAQGDPFHDPRRDRQGVPGSGSWAGVSFHGARRGGIQCLAPTPSLTSGPKLPTFDSLDWLMARSDPPTIETDRRW